ncbi:MAG: hypothetical protein K8L97_07125, partial [Anaerolineae bacterium]|nr:hypothetical protein [Anaerolineae bacterium]
YPLTRGARLIVNTAALARPEIQSLLWFMAEDASYAMLDGSNLIGIPFGDLPALRETLLQAYKQAETAALISPEATPEPVVEATAEATVEATSEAITEPTAEATIEATPELAVEATAEATVEATPEATVEATSEMTPEATAAAGS